MWITFGFSKKMWINPVFFGKNWEFERVERRMAIHFILGGSGRGKSYYVNHMVSEMAQKEPETQFIMLVPEQFTMQTQKDMVNISSCHGIMNIDVQSFIRLAYRIFGETGAGNLPVLDDMGKTMILRKVLSECQGEMKYFGKNVQKKGYLTEIKSFLSELFQYGIDQETLQDMIDSAVDRPVLQKKLQDMAVAYNAFVSYLENNYITSEEVLGVLCDVVGQSQILKNAVICLDGFTGFTPVQYRLIEELMVHCRDIYLTVTISKGEEIVRTGPKHSLFYMSRKTMEKFRYLAGKHQIEICQEVWTGENVEETRFKEAKGLNHLEKHLFRYPMKTYNDIPEDISLHILKQPEQEIAFVVQEAQALCRKGFRYRDMAVVTGDMEIYGLLAAEAFEKAGLPCFIDQKKSILGHPFVEMIRSFLDILIQDFSYDSVMRYLKGRYGVFAKEEIDILDNFLLASGIRGHKKWQEEWNASYVFSLWEEEKQQAINQQLNEIRQKVWGLFQKSYEEIAKGKHTMTEYARVLVLFMEEQGFYRAVMQDAKAFQEIGERQTAKEYEQVYEIVVGVIDRLVELLGKEKMNLKEFRELLETGFSEARVGLIPPGVDQIVVGDITRTRLADVKYLFFLGVNDSNIPKGAGGGGVLSSAERSFLEQEEYELKPTEREAVYTEQFYLYLNLTKPQKHLYLCFCETGNDGKPQNPAYLVDRIEKLFPKLEIQVEELRQDPEHILGDDLGMNYLIKGLRNEAFADGKWQELFRYYWGKEDRRKEIEPILAAAFYREEKSSLSKASAKTLYQSVLRGSASQLEKYAACSYAYFLQYGLRLKERAERAVEFFDIGNIVHEALELYTKMLIRQGKTWQELTEKEQHIEANQCLNQVVEQYKNGLLYDTHRDTYLISRLRRILQRTVWAITQQMSQGVFRTVDSELKFAQLQGPLNLVGKVDRVDKMEQEDASYVTIIDYKTGKKDISLSDLYYGLQMQLVIYLDAAVQEETKRKKMVIPAGVFYYNIEDPVLESGVKEEERDKAILSALRLKGLINEDDPVLPSVDGSFATESGALPASTVSQVAPFETDRNGDLKKKSAAVTTKDFQLIMNFAKDKLQGMTQEILDGTIEKNPYKREDSAGATACDYCPYHPVCQFDAKLSGQSYRSIKKLSDDDALQKINEKMKTETD